MFLFQVAPTTDPVWYESGRILLTVVSVIGNVFLAGLVAWTLARSKTTEILRGEKEAWKDKAERLDEECKETKTRSAAKDVELAELRTKTDLKPVLERLELMLSTFQQFESKNNEVHMAMIASLQANTLAIQQTATTLKEHFGEDKKLFEELRELLQGKRDA